MKSFIGKCASLAVVPVLFVASASLVDGAETEHAENEWVKQSPREGAPVPPVGWEGGGAFDPHRNQWIHHAGHDGIPQGFHLFTWDRSSGAWEQRFPNTSPPGACCVDGAMTFDEANDRFVRFPGASLGHGYQWSRGVHFKNSAVWLYDPEAKEWTNMRPPPHGKAFNAREDLGRLNAGATYDPSRGLCLSFGGQGNSGGTNNLFAYDAFANELYRLPGENAPSPRDGMGVTYDTRNDCLVMFGSQYANDEKTWLYRFETGRWEGHALDPHPPGKKAGTYATIPRLAYDSINGVCLGVVWDTNSGEHQTWVLDVGKLRWKRMKPPAEPSPSMSRSRNLAYSPRENLFLLELSPKDRKGKGVELWTYRYRGRPGESRLASPEDLAVTTDRDRAMLAWSAVPGAAKGYHVYRAGGGPLWKAEFTRVAQTGETRYEDRDLTPGQVYFYRVMAVDGQGRESPPAPPVRTQPRVPGAPVVSVLRKDRIEVKWAPLKARDVAGYNIYRGLVTVRTVTKGVPKPWKDNDPEYAAPVPVEVKAITKMQKLNDRPLTETSWTETLDLTQAGPESDGYRYAVHAYVVKAVNRRGTESGPSPYALTLPSAPVHVLNREQGKTAELKWQANPEKGIVGYHVYKLEGTWNIVRVTDEPIKETTWRHEGGSGTTRYWVVAVDALGQEGEPSSPVWHQQSYKGFFKGDWHQ